MLLDAALFQVGYCVNQLQIRSNIMLELQKLRDSKVKFTNKNNSLEEHDTITEVRMSIQRAMYGTDTRLDSVDSASRRSRSRESVTFLTESLRKALLPQKNQIVVEPTDSANLSATSLSTPLLSS
jgi:hypothetical protein